MIVVRLVQPRELPLPPANNRLVRLFKIKDHPLLTLTTGSCLGLLSGLAIFYVFKSSGLASSGLESSLIVALPAVFGFITSYVNC